MFRALRPLVLVPLVVAAAFAFAPPPAAAWECQNDVDELRKDIKANEDKYDDEHRREALKHLRQAELHRINPVECRKDVAAARKALLGGRKLRKDDADGKKGDGGALEKLRDRDE